MSATTKVSWADRIRQLCNLAVANNNAAMPRKRIFVVEPQLVFLDGHEHTQIKAIKKLLPGCDVFTFTRRDFKLSDALDGESLLPVLPVAGTATDRKRQKRSNGKSVAATSAQDRYRAFAEAIGNALNDQQAIDSDLILVPSAGQETISAAVLLQEMRGRTAVPKIKLRILSNEILADLDADLLQRIREYCASGQIGILTETAELRARIEDHYRIPVSGRLMLPCALMPDEDVTPPAAKRPGEEFKVGILGRQRAEKGSYRVPAILKQLRSVAAERGGGQRFRFVYQAVKNKRARRLVLEIRTWLGARKNPEVTIQYLTSGMSDDDFRQLVRDVDILLLPYSTRRYALSGSGIILDGVLARKPMVFSRGMANRELLSLGNAEAAASDREFAEMILKVASDYERYRQGAENAAEYYSSMVHAQMADVFETADGAAAGSG